MEILTSILAAAVPKIGQCFCGSICPKIKSVIQFKANLNELERGTKKITDRSNDVKHELEPAERNGKSPTTEVKNWLRDVEEFIAKVNSVRAAAAVNDERLCGCLCSYNQRIRLSSKVEKLIKEVKTLLKAGSFPDGKNLNNKLSSASSHQPFSIVIWITVSKEVDLKRVQKQIADRLSLEMEMEESVDRSAGRLHQRLEKEKFLLILDDVWD
ncbi:hypothetical protein TIFTF001_051626, partial [Ficus carica]